MERESSQSQVMGKKKYREMIHKDSKKADQKNLPYTFSRPKKDKPLNTYFKCEKCSRESAVSEETYMVICAACKHLNKVKNLKKKG
jgi:hypothetical protein